VIFLKSGIGLKLAVGALGLLLGIGGIAVGAHLHSSQSRLETRRVVVAQIVAINGDAITVHTRSGLTGTAMLLPGTVIRLHGRAASRADLAVGDIVIEQIERTPKGQFVILRIWIVRLAHAPAPALAP
jgi:hypothetical protein